MGGRRACVPRHGAVSACGEPRAKEEARNRTPRVRTVHAVSEAEAKPFLDAGEAHLRAGELAAAERAFRDAVDAAPDSALAHSKLGVALAQQRRLDEAIGEFSRAVALQPSYAPAHSNLGNAYREKGMTAEAVASYERAVALDPDYWIAHQNLGALYKEMGQVGDAVEHFKRATRLSMRQPTGDGGGTRRRLGCLPGLIATAGLVLLVAGGLFAGAFR